MILAAEELHSCPVGADPTKPAEWALFRALLEKQKMAPQGQLLTHEHVKIAAGVVLGITAPAEVNHGRWIVRCPTPGCFGANVTARTDRRTWCVYCENAVASGAWIVVDWPAEADEIEAVLGLRPDPRTRNWVPGETPDELRVENRANGVAA